jgi:hypothetical protein
MKTSEMITALAAGLAVYLIAKSVWGPDQYGLDRSSQQSQMLAEQDRGLAMW